MPPQFPIGAFEPIAIFNEADRQQLTQQIKTAPHNLRELVTDLPQDSLDKPYKNWTIRQITHHLADSHVHSYIRFKWTLTEDQPRIKAYEEGDWAKLDDARHGDVEPSLHLLAGLHDKWSQLLDSMDEQQFGRSFQHPQSGEQPTLWEALNYYAWHGRHHTGQIKWLVDNRLD